MATQNLTRLRKDALVAMVEEVTRANSELNERLLGAAIIGGATGFLLGLALAWG